LYFRLAVRGFSLDAYGLASAWIGAHMLLRGVLVLPLGQLLTYRYFTQGAQDQRDGFARTVFRGLLAASGLLWLLAMAGLAVFPPTSSGWFFSGCLVGALGLADAVKSFVLVRFNLREQHGSYAAIQLGESALRIALFYLLLPLSGGRPELLVVIPTLSAAAIVFLFRGRTLEVQDGVTVQSLLSLLRAHYSFLGPVALLAFTAWVTSLSDRFLLLNWVSERETGRYAAVAGLFCTPFPLLVSSLVLVYRPRLVALAANPETRRHYATTKRQLLALGSAGAVLLALLLWLSRHLLGHVLLRPEHQTLFPLLPWLLAGQVALAVGQLFEVQLYVQNSVNLVIIKQFVGFSAALISMFILIRHYGVEGAMIACAIYYTAECLCGAVLAARKKHWPAQTAPDSLSS